MLDSAQNSPSSAGCSLLHSAQYLALLGSRSISNLLWLSLALAAHHSIHCFFEVILQLGQKLIHWPAQLILCHSIHLIFLPSFRVADNVSSCPQNLEGLLSPGMIIFVRVNHHCQLPIGLLQFNIRCCAPTPNTWKGFSASSGTPAMVNSRATSSSGWQ